MDRLNLYQLLALDPSVEDWETIAAAITGLRRRWSIEAKMGSLAERRKVEKKLKELPQIEAWMRDPARRAAEAEASRKLVAAGVFEPAPPPPPAAVPRSAVAEKTAPPTAAARPEPPVPKPALPPRAAGPPPPPSLRVRRQGKGLRLTWEAAPCAGAVTYWVVRKPGSPPVDPSDGTVLDEVRGTRFDDERLPSGTLHYAVFTVRDGVASRRGATDRPWLIPRPVSGLTAEVGGRRVLLRWKPPQGCTEVEVWRSTPGEEAGEPRHRVAVEGDSALDTEVVSGQPYVYEVVPVFPWGESRERGPGYRIHLTPAPPPPPVIDLAARLDGATVELRWTSPRLPRAGVEIRLCRDLPAGNPGDLISVDRAGRFGPPVAAGRGAAEVELAEHGVYYFVPLTVLGETAVVGRAAAVAYVEEVGGLEARAAGPRIVLTWQWPAAAAEVRICYSYRRYPEDPAAGHVHRAVDLDRAGYDEDDGWVLGDAERRRHFFTVFARHPESGLYSAGRRVLVPMGQTPRVAYRVVTRKSLWKRQVTEAHVELTAVDQGCDLLEGLQVVLKERHPPLAADDGVVLTTVGALALEDGAATIAIPDAHLARKGYLKLFFDNPEDAQMVRLRPAAKEHLRLG